MESLSTFIKIYILSIAAFLIPSANDTSNQLLILSNSKIDIDGFIQNTSDSDFELADKTNNHTANKIAYIDIENETAYFQFSSPSKDEKTYDDIQIKPSFWTTLYSIESKQGRLLYRPSNQSKNCKTTSAPCGHHQLSLQALKDISCTSKKCMSDREDFKKSLAMSKKLQAINDKRLAKAGLTRLPEYQEYLIHQQGAAGLKIILAASQGRKVLNRNIKRNMAGNSPYSYKQLKKLGSKLAAKKFLQHWEKKWQNEKKLVISSSVSNKNTETVIKPESKIKPPLFNDYELQIALNLKI